VDFFIIGFPDIIFTEDKQIRPNHIFRIIHTFNHVNIFLHFLKIFSESAFQEQKKPDYPQITRLYSLIFFY